MFADLGHAGRDRRQRGHTQCAYPQVVDPDNGDHLLKLVEPLSFNPRRES